MSELPNLEYCNGCNVGFSPTGYHSHLRQTRDPLCSAIYRAQFQRAHVNLEDNTAESRIDDDFEQDDQPGFPADIMTRPEIDSDEEMDVDQQDQDVGWEPVRAGAHIEPDDHLDENNPEEEDRHETHETVDRTEIKPKIVRYSDRYPEQKAGIIRKQKMPLDHDYQKEVAEKDNPYAPFSSKMDWELGKWGKMRSAGSTAFDELLTIDEVSLPDHVDPHDKMTCELDA